MTTLFRPDFLFQEGQLRKGQGLWVDDTGCVVAPGVATRVVDLPGRLLLPGFVNAHSHAFQRVLRGRFEYVEKGRVSDDFWSWREGMYRAAESMTPSDVYDVSRQAFLEMALAGITTVGEFHYLHHQPDGQPYADVHEIAHHVIAAANDVGLRMVFLRVGYQRAGFGQPANPRQRRFLSRDAETFLAATADLKHKVKDKPLVTVGIAPHSVRAVDKAFLTALAKERAMLTHMHVAEQEQEVHACLAEHSRRPVEFLNELGLLHEQFTAVHAIHLSKTEVEFLGVAKSHVCACPSTERNLGDGVVPADALLKAKVRLCFGSDSQAEIDVLEETKSLEGHLRLFHRRRAVMDDGSGRPQNLGETLLQMATRGGAEALSLPVGTLALGQPADFLTVDLSHPSLLGTSPDGLLPALALGAEKSAIRDVAVQGRWVVQDGRHALSEEIAQRYVRTALKVLSVPRGHTAAHLLVED